MRILFVFLLATLSHAALAQDRDGNDTPGEWVIDHQKAFGLWDSFCDHRTTDGLREQRCYLRYVEVFSPRPKFGAQFAFVTKGPEVEFGMEAGTFFQAEGFRIETDGAVIWAKPQAGCLVGLACTYEGAEATEILDAMVAGDVFKFDFTDRHGQPQSLVWGVKSFRHALADFKAQSALRGL